MKIVSWNCNGKFRVKYDVIFKINADIYVIQECENPKKYPTVFSKIPMQSFWTGSDENKGLCVFASPEITIRDNQWDTYALRHFASYRIDDRFDLLCVWASKPYIEEYYIYQSIHFNKFHKDMVIIGDFNSNRIWDKENKERNHSAVVRQLEGVGLVSAYHYLTKEPQGEEQQPTFFLYRDPSRAYHIDHCFTNPAFIRDYRIENNREWLVYSDHFPMQLEIEIDA
ncbi:MAG: endonuclease/exonuclease/phosphatase family protein [Clostridia bacterium]|nr:endonuclease/exonuclease/phosphatase family protein [Clostridia bacterium]